MRKIYYYSLRSPRQTKSGKPEIKETEMFIRVITGDIGSSYYLMCYLSDNTKKFYKHIFKPVEGLVDHNTVWFYDKPDMERARLLFLQDKKRMQKEFNYPNGLVDTFVEFLSKTPV